MIKEFIENLFHIHKIDNISTDSREVNSRSAFFFLGSNPELDFHYIVDAIKKGARLIFTNNTDLSNYEISAIRARKIIYVNNIYEALAIAANFIYPDQPKFKCAVTGTNGKTSISYYFYQLCKNLNLNSASIGTLGIIHNSSKPIRSYQKLTTETYINNKRNLFELAKQKIDHVCMEASSHAIDQNRLNDIVFNVAAFSSFSQDHLDYHNSIENYLNTKLKLFKKNMHNKATIILNREMEFYDEIIKFVHLECYAKIITVGYLDSLNKSKYNKMSKNCNILEIYTQNEKTIINFEYDNKIYEISVDIAGSYQAINILIASIMLENLGENFSNITKMIPLLKSPPGRLERIINTNIFIDYAHSPESLELSIKELIKVKKSKESKLIVIFGCGGDRDKSKRKIMGKIAEKLSDFTIITDDNPRNEDPSLIRADILSELTSQNIFEIPNRADAIKKGIKLMKKDDILLIAGKGHEKFQIIRNSKVEFDEFKIVKDYLKYENLEKI